MNGFRLDTNDDAYVLKEVNPLIAGLRDIDGNRYQTVTIGSQMWIVENLRVTTYSDGSPIVNVTDAGVWAALATGGYCSYDNDSANIPIYGLLYNHFATTNLAYLEYNGVQQIGWRIPTEADILALTAELGLPILSRGGKLKETGITYWSSPNQDATNETGFSARGAGGRTILGAYAGINAYAFFWMTAINASTANNMYLSAVSGTLSYGSVDKNFGSSVRLVRDI